MVRLVKKNARNPSPYARKAGRRLPSAVGVVSAAQSFTDPSQLPPSWEHFNDKQSWTGDEDKILERMNLKIVTDPNMRLAGRATAKLRGMHCISTLDPKKLINFEHIPDDVRCSDDIAFTLSVLNFAGYYNDSYVAKRYPGVFTTLGVPRTGNSHFGPAVTVTFRTDEGIKRKFVKFGEYIFGGDNVGKAHFGSIKETLPDCVDIEHVCNQDFLSKFFEEEDLEKICQRIESKWGDAMAKKFMGEGDIPVNYSEPEVLKDVKPATVPFLPPLRICKTVTIAVEYDDAANYEPAPANPDPDSDPADQEVSADDAEQNMALAPASNTASLLKKAKRMSMEIPRKPFIAMNMLAKNAYSTFNASLRGSSSIENAFAQYAAYNASKTSVNGKENLSQFASRNASKTNLAGRETPAIEDAPPVPAVPASTTKAKRLSGFRSRRSSAAQATPSTPPTEAFVARTRGQRDVRYPLPSFPAGPLSRIRILAASANITAETRYRMIAALYEAGEHLYPVYMEMLWKGMCEIAHIDGAFAEYLSPLPSAVITLLQDRLQHEQEGRPESEWIWQWVLLETLMSSEEDLRNRHGQAVTA